MRLSTLMAFFVLCTAGYFVYQTQQADALVAAPPQQEEQPAKPAEDTAQNFLKFTCTPEAFHLTLNEDGYRLHGTLETPTPGYNYTPLRVVETDSGADMVFQLNGPAGDVIQVISKMEIDHMYVRDAALQEMNVRLEKTFDWGPDKIACTAVAEVSDTETETPTDPTDIQEQKEEE